VWLSVRAEAQIGLAVNEARGNDDMWWWWADALGGERSRPEYQDPKKGDGAGTSSRRVGVGRRCSRRHSRVSGVNKTKTKAREDGLRRGSSFRSERGSN
jgi:hypothetical protein